MKNKNHLHTQEVICREVISIPHLQVESWWDLVFSFIPCKHGLLLGDYNLLLCHQVVEGVDEPPVEIALTGQGVVVNVCVLLVLLLPFEPTGTK